MFIRLLFLALVIIKVLLRFTETKKGSSFGLKKNTTSVRNNNEFYKKTE